MPESGTERKRAEFCNLPRHGVLQAFGDGMDPQHRHIRAQLSSMAPRRAVAYIRSFELPPDEMACLVECDVYGKSYAQVSEQMHVSPEYVKKRRRRAFAKIADEINNA